MSTPAPALLLAGSWAALVLLAAARHRPAPARARALTASPAGTKERRPDVLAVIGRAVLRRLPPSSATPSPLPVLKSTARQGRFADRNGRPAAVSAPVGATERGVGITTVAALCACALTPVLVPLVVVAGWAAPRHRARATERRRLHALESALPDTVDLLVLAVGAGCNVPLALAATGRRGTGPLAAEVRRVSAEVARGRRLADALDELPARAGEPTRALASVLAGCERYGTPVLPALQRLADEVRLQRQRRAEAAARRVPVTLLFPLVLCILPAFALLTVAPLIAGALRELRLQ